MYNQSGIGWFIATVIVIIFAAVIINGNNSKNTDSKAKSATTIYQPAYVKPTTNYTVPKYVTTETKTTAVTWHCVDATSYNKNAYDDNKCTSSTGEVRYVSDSQARTLDPSYTPGTSGHPYYNSK